MSSEKIRITEIICLAFSILAIPLMIITGPVFALGLLFTVAFIFD